MRDLLFKGGGPALDEVTEVAHGLHKNVGPKATLLYTLFDAMAVMSLSVIDRVDETEDTEPVVYLSGAFFLEG